MTRAIARAQQIGYAPNANHLKKLLIEHRIQTHVDDKRQTIVDGGEKNPYGEVHLDQIRIHLNVVRDEKTNANGHSEHEIANIQTDSCASELFVASRRLRSGRSAVNRHLIARRDYKHYHFQVEYVVDHNCG